MRTHGLQVILALAAGSFLLALGLSGGDRRPLPEARAWPPAIEPAREPAREPRTHEAAQPQADLKLPSVEDDPAAFRAVFDSLLVTADLRNAAVREAFEAAARKYLEARDDSLLLGDLRFALGSAPEARAAWHAGVQLDEAGWALREEGDHEGSADAFRRAGEIYARVGHLRREAVVWGSLGVSLWYTGDLEGTEKAYERALDARRRLGDPVLIGNTLNGLGSVNLELARYADALDYYRRARAVRETLDRPTDLGRTLAYTGNAYYRTGHLAEARAHYELALGTFTPETPVRYVNEARIGMANVYGDLGEPRRALEMNREILASAEEMEDPSTAASARVNMAHEHLALGEHAAALMELRRALEIQESLNEHSSLASTTNALGSVYLQIGDLPEALKAFRDAERLATEPDDPLTRATAITNQGRVYSRMETYERAFEAYDRALAMFEEIGYPAGIRDVLLGRAATHERREEYARAHELYRETLDLDLEREFLGKLPEDYVSLGNILAAQGRLDEGLEMFRRALPLAVEADDRDMIWPCYLGMADCFEQAGALDSALAYNRRALEAMESQREMALSEATKADWLQERALVYEAQVHVMAQLHAGDPAAGFDVRALELAERGKAQAFRDLLGEGTSRLDQDLDPQLAAAREELRLDLKAMRFLRREAKTAGVPVDSLKALDARIDGLEREEAALLERIRLENPRLAALDPPGPAGLEEIRRTLIPGSRGVILEYSLGDSASYLWVIEAGGLAFHRLPPRRDIEPQVGSLMSALRNPGMRDHDLVETAASLYTTLVRPAERALATARTVYLVPDGVLHLIPFGALVAERPSTERPSTERPSTERPSTVQPGPANRPGGRPFEGLTYAFQETPVHYGPSATTLVTLASRDRTGKRPMEFLGVGDPAYAGAGGAAGTRGIGDISPLDAGSPGQGWAPLPRTRDEVNRIAAVFDPGARTVLVGREAAEPVLVKPGYLARYRILHFATHGVAYQNHPERSAIVLSYPADPSEDGYLQASEVYGLDLAADLVVLSACETGVGRMVRGEGVLGLPRAFLYAGASSVVVSLWKVADRSAVEMMPAFYEEMARGEPPAEALRLASARVRGMEGFAHPFYWAPFVLLGAGS